MVNGYRISIWCDSRKVDEFISRYPYEVCHWFNESKWKSEYDLGNCLYFIHRIEDTEEKILGTSDALNFIKDNDLNKTVSELNGYFNVDVIEFLKCLRDNGTRINELTDGRYEVHVNGFHELHECSDLSKWLNSNANDNWVTPSDELHNQSSNDN